MDASTVKQLVELSREKKRKEAELKELKSEIARLQALVADDFIEDGISNTKIDGATVYIQREFTFKKSVDDNDLHRWLHDHGLGDVIKTAVPYQTLRSVLRDFAEDESKRADLAEVVEYDYFPLIRVRES